MVGYLRVSQVGLEAHAQPVVPAAAGARSGRLPRPRGVPYCPFDGLMYPLGATFCAACERDLLLDCANCGATVAASASVLLPMRHPHGRRGDVERGLTDGRSGPCTGADR